MDLENKIVVVTGGGSGIGLSIVKKFLASCDVKYVAIFELDLPERHAVFNDLKTAYGERIGFYPCNVAKPALLFKNFDKVIASHGTIDILINNAGVGCESDPELLIDVNLKGVIVASNMLIDRIGKHKGGKGGVIVNIASVLGLKNDKMPVYSATKHGVVSFTRTMKGTYDVTGVRVVAVCPGMTGTGILSKAVEKNDILKKQFADSPYYMQTPENVAAAVISIIRNGEPGDVWVSKDDEPPYSVGSVEDYKSLKIKDYPA